MTAAGGGRDRLGRWRLVLGGHEADGVTTADGSAVGLSPDDARRDQALAQLYDSERNGRGGMGASSPRVAR
jgi:hypothetical protein